MKEPEKTQKPYTWWDDIKFGIGAPLILLSVPALLILAVFSMFGGGSTHMNWPLFFILFTIIAAVML